MPLAETDRRIIFDKIKGLLKDCTPPMLVAKDKQDVFEIMGNKPMPYGSKKQIVPGIYFSSVVARKDMISYYYFPIYFRHEDYIELIPETKKYLKGKTCFNFKKPEQVNEKELKALLKKGVQAWKKLGYLE